VKFETYDLKNPGQMKTLWEAEERYKTLYVEMPDGGHLGLQIDEFTGGLKINTTNGQPLTVLPQASNTITVKEGTHK